MELKPKQTCPMDGFKSCRQLDCGWFTQVRGHNPNTGKEVDEWGCAIAWLPVLLIENSSQSRQTGAAVESLRNVVVEGNKESMKILAMGVQHETVRIEQ